ncbi:hypothetical protein GCM10022288_01680 [Gryllotalpicola kribbensis]|uniref:Uncharacterized protein n=1 Tax=Gryllotalpicola kribbensis TaxID=993084 RepID=A0ABP8AFC9_9MICO
MEEEIMTPAAVAHQVAEPGTVEGETIELDVIPVDDHGWRVSVHGADRGNPFALLGFVTQVGDGFEVCVIGRPGDAIAARTLDEAVDVLRPAPDELDDILAGVRH